MYSTYLGGSSRYRGTGIAGDSAGNTYLQYSNVFSRIDELARRVTNKCIERISERTAVTREYIIEQLLNNAELARKSGAYGPRNRALELMGKELGMFGDVQPPPPPHRFEDLPTSILEQLLAQSEQSDDEPPVQ